MRTSARRLPDPAAGFSLEAGVPSGARDTLGKDEEREFRLRVPLVDAREQPSGLANCGA
jgi:hypothetical protein